MATCSSILAEECHGQRRLAGYSPRHHKELVQDLMSEHVCVLTFRAYAGEGKQRKKTEKASVKSIQRSKLVPRREWRFRKW